MAAADCNFRFMANNFASLTINEITASSEKVGFEANNSVSDFRSEVWKTTGRFLIQEDVNDKIYFNDGSDKTAQVAASSYSSPSSLATAMASALNAVGSGFSVTYDSAGGTYKFTLTNSSSYTLRLATAMEAIWDTIGFTGTTDRSGDTDYEADEQRNHTSEFIRFDFGFQAQIDFVAIISDVASDLPFSSAATITLKANNIDDEASAPLSKTLTREDKGIFEFIDDDFPVAANRSYRFWFISFEDKYNPNGPEAFGIGNIYLGDFTYLQNRNIDKGFNFSNFDPSTSSESQAGVLFFDERTKFDRIKSVAVNFLDETDKQTIIDTFRTVGRTIPFYISLDPGLNISNTLTTFTKFVLFEREPTFTHITHDLFSTVLEFREVV